jgi:hypothetical protein
MLRYYLLEEYRRHASIAKKYSLIVFPLYVIFFVTIGASFVEEILSIFPYRQFIILTMLSTFIYGFGVSSFEFLGRGREKGSLSQITSILPMKNKKNYFYLFLRDAIYYTVFFIIPTFIGLVISIPFSSLTFSQIIDFSVSLTISMFIGYSLGYLSFSLWYQRKIFYYAFLAFLLIYLLLIIFSILPFPPAEFQVSKNPSFLIFSLILIMLISFIAYEITPPEIIEYSKERGNSLMKYHRVFKNILLAKEMEDVIRGGIIVKSLFTYFLPMLLLFVFIKIINMSMGKEVYNPLSLSVMLSIFSAVIYSWLTIMEDFDYLQTLPLRASDVVMTHIKVYFIIITLISLPIIFLLNSHTLNLLPFSIGLFYLNSTYLLFLTAYIAGPKITSLLFNPGIILRFSLYSIVPGMILVIGTFEQSIYSITAVIITASIMILLTYINFKRIKRKWLYF